VTAGRPVRRDLALVLLTLAALLAWDASGADLVVSRGYGDAGGFALRDAWWPRRVLHDGGRHLSALALGATLLLAWGRRPAGRARRLAGWAMVPLAMLGVSALKQLSATSCPWDVAAFGGHADYVSHWLLSRGDGGPGRCFPSGHAAAAFGFWPLFFLWRDERPHLARAVLLGAGAAGLAFGWVQVARGAHYPSHVLWTAWLCWTFGALASRALAGLPRGLDARRADPLSP
jgi:membrane-associated PAP2 superfamily phosphatase